MTFYYIGVGGILLELQFENPEEAHHRDYILYTTPVQAYAAYLHEMESYLEDKVTDLDDLMKEVAYLRISVAQLKEKIESLK